MWGLDSCLHLWVCQNPVSMRYGIRAERYIQGCIALFCTETRLFLAFVL